MKHMAARSLGRLAALTEQAREVEEATHAHVIAARVRGATWDDIGRVLGVTRQSAWQRFGQPATPSPPPIDVVRVARSADFAQEIIALADADPVVSSWLDQLNADIYDMGYSQQPTRPRTMLATRELQAYLLTYLDMLDQQSGRFE